jgi:hypothetical protein
VIREVTPYPTFPGEEETPVPETPGPTPDPNDPFRIYEFVDPGEPYTPQSLVRRFDVIVVGTVTEVLPARWTTPDGSRPANPHETVPEEFTIFTPVVIELDAPPLLARPEEELSSYLAEISTSGRIVVATLGGTVGDDAVVTENFHHKLELGDRVVTALSSAYFDDQARQSLFATEAGAAWTPGQTYQLDNDGTAVTIGESGFVAMNSNELITMILNAVEEGMSTATPSPATPSPALPTPTISSPSVTPSVSNTP